VPRKKTPRKPVFKWYGLIYLFFIPADSYRLSSYALPFMRSESKGDAIDAGVNLVALNWYDDDSESFICPSSGEIIQPWKIIAKELPVSIAKAFEQLYLKIEKQNGRVPKKSQSMAKVITGDFGKKVTDKEDDPPDDPKRPKD